MTESNVVILQLLPGRWSLLPGPPQSGLPEAVRRYGRLVSGLGMLQLARPRNPSPILGALILLW